MLRLRDLTVLCSEKLGTISAVGDRRGRNSLNNRYRLTDKREMKFEAEQNTKLFPSFKSTQVKLLV